MKCLIEEWAKADGKPSRQWLTDWLHKHQWNVNTVAARLGITPVVVYREMRKMDIPTIEEYLSFEYQGQFGTVTEHALRVSVCPHMAYRRYMAGLPLEDVYRDIDDYDIANLERMAAQGMTADSISAVTEFTPETVAAVTGAKRADYVNKKERRAAARKLLRNNPHHTAASLAVYIRRYTDAFIEKDRAVTSCQTEMHDPLNDELYEDDLDPDEDAEHDDDEHQ